MTTQSLAFQNTTFDIVDQNGQPWLKAQQIGEALGYTDEKSINRIYTRNADEFNEHMTGVVKVTTSGNLQTDVRIFSMRGAHLLAMLSRTKIAKAFRKWVLDILDGSARTPARTSTVIDRRPLDAAVKNMVSVLGKRGKAINFSDAWSLVHVRMGIGSVEELTTEQIPQALAVIGSILEGEVLGREALPPAQQELLASDSPNMTTQVLAFMHKAIRMMTDKQMVIVEQPDLHAVLTYAAQASDVLKSPAPDGSIRNLVDSYCLSHKAAGASFL